MSDDIKQRLKDTSENCLKTYEAWADSRKDQALRESLQEAVHELRKVTARLEIEIAVSERKETKQKPLPIPPHRSSKRRSGNNDDGNNELPSFISGDNNDNGDDKKNNKGGKSSGRRRAPRKKSGGDDN
ncbi:MAG: hypothetical protein CMH28_06825 [Micavibrio sp.]|nr:hypothetical protein [Micavibrio sp.]|tara:strand:+ start:124 stop:510 length:387 start_codon:yes stop_codon:yes gene_type:complete